MPSNGNATLDLAHRPSHLSPKVCSYFLRKAVWATSLNSSRHVCRGGGHRGSGNQAASLWQPRCSSNSRQCKKCGAHVYSKDPATRARMQSERAKIARLQQLCIRFCTSLRFAHTRHSPSSSSFFFFPSSIPFLVSFFVFLLLPFFFLKQFPNFSHEFSVARPYVFHFSGAGTHPFRLCPIFV